MVLLDYGQLRVFSFCEIVDPSRLLLLLLSESFDRDAAVAAMVSWTMARGGGGARGEA